MGAGGPAIYRASISGPAKNPEGSTAPNVAIPLRGACPKPPKLFPACAPSSESIAEPKPAKPAIVFPAKPAPARKRDIPDTGFLVVKRLNKSPKLGLFCFGFKLI